jgi:hypothetical protein
MSVLVALWPTGCLARPPSHASSVVSVPRLCPSYWRSYHPLMNLHCPLLRVLEFPLKGVTYFPLIGILNQHPTMAQCEAFVVVGGLEMLQRINNLHTRTTINDICSHMWYQHWKEGKRFTMWWRCDSKCRVLCQRSIFLHGWLEGLYRTLGDWVKSCIPSSSSSNHAK